MRPVRQDGAAKFGARKGLARPAIAENDGRAATWALGTGYAYLNKQSLT
jgi:hypothetical protein